VDGSTSSTRYQSKSLALDKRRHLCFRLVTQQGIAQPAVVSSLSYLCMHADARPPEQWL